MKFDLKPPTPRAPDQALYPLSLEVTPEAIKARYIQHDSVSHNDCFDFEYRQYAPWQDIRVVCFFGDTLIIESNPEFRQIELGKETYRDMKWPWYKCPQWMWHRLELPVPPHLKESILEEIRKYRPVITDPSNYTKAVRPKMPQFVVEPPQPGMEIFM